MPRAERVQGRHDRVEVTQKHERGQQHRRLALEVAAGDSGCTADAASNSRALKISISFSPRGDEVEAGLEGINVHAAQSR
jgi:hypothetical protein